MSLLSTAMDTDKTPMATGQNRLVIELRGLGPVPSFKTGKRGTWGKTATGKVYARPVTKREHRRWMQKVIQVIELQFLSAMRDSEDLTLTEPPQQSSTVSRALVETFVNEFDDKWKYVRRLIVESDPCDNGFTGATITIERR